MIETKRAARCTLLVVVGTVLFAGCTSPVDDPDDGLAAPERRDDENRVIAPGTGELTVGASGGVVRAKGIGDARVSLEVPAGALDREVTIRILPAQPAAGFEARGAFFTFEPDGLQFAKPVRASFEYAGDPEEARIVWTKPGTREFEPLPTSIEGAMATATISHFSGGGVVRSSPPMGDQRPTIEQALTGHFQTSGTSTTGPSQARGCRVSAPALGDFVVWHATRPSNGTFKAGKFFALTANGPDVIVRTFSWSNPAAARDERLCNEPDRLAGLGRDELYESSGCIVTLHFSEGAFHATTQRGVCGTPLAGAAYATTELMIERDRHMIWERLFDANGAQVAGETAPFVFTRTALPDAGADAAPDVGAGG